MVVFNYFWELDTWLTVVNNLANHAMRACVNQGSHERMSQGTKGQRDKETLALFPHRPTASPTLVWKSLAPTRAMTFDRKIKNDTTFYFFSLTPEIPFNETQKDGFVQNQQTLFKLVLHGHSTRYFGAGQIRIFLLTIPKQVDPFSPKLGGLGHWVWPIWPKTKKNGLTGTVKSK